jgi:PAS domain S-box-containing protein
MASLVVLAPVLIWSFIEFRSAKNNYILADTIRVNFFERASFRDQYFLYREDRARMLWDKSKEAADNLLRQAEVKFRREEDRQVLEHLRKHIEDTAIIFHRIVNNTEALNTATGNRQVYNELDKRLYSQLLLKATSVRDAVIALQDASARRVEQTYQYLTIIIGLFSIILALATILTSIQIGRLIRRRLSPLHDGAKIVADGNLDYRINTDGADEFSELALSINAMTGKLSAEISAHKQVEEMLRKLSTAIEQSPLSVVITDLDANIQYVNPHFMKVTGYSREEALGQNPRILQSGQTSKETYDELWDALTNGRVWRGELVNKRKNSEFYWEEVHISPVMDSAGNPMHYVAVKLEITRRKQAEEELKRSNAELEQFSYAVSHDMRQPLRMISSYLQLLERSLANQLDGEKRDYFNFAIEGAKRIDQMLVALLEYSRVGRKGEPPTWVESRALLDEALQFLQPAIAEAQAVVNVSGEWPSILVSHDEILRLIQNLIGNAVKYRIAGRIPEITVTGETIKNEWRLCVADNGVGIIPDQIKRLFQVFQRLQSRDAYEGTGIGLALCRKIAEHHKGRIWAESAGEGKGSQFHVVLPVLREKT